MKFMSECGHIIYDITDNLSYKAHLISDQDWFNFLDEIDEAIEKSGPTQKDKESACMKIRSLSSELHKSVYQCKNCGNMFFNNNLFQLEMFRSHKDNPNKTLLQSSKGDN
jgi:hypothetical protein